MFLINNAIENMYYSDAMHNITSTANWYTLLLYRRNIMLRNSSFINLTNINFITTNDKKTWKYTANSIYISNQFKVMPRIICNLRPNYLRYNCFLFNVFYMKKLKFNMSWRHKVISKTSIHSNDIQKSNNISFITRAAIFKKQASQRCKIVIISVVSNA